MTDDRVRGVAPGAVGVFLDGAMRVDEARSLVAAPFAGLPTAPDILVDGPLVLAWTSGAGIATCVSNTTVCLLLGAVYDSAGFGSDQEPSQPMEKRLAAAYRRLGDDVPALLRGDFMTVLWDRDSRRGIVAADHMGTRCPFWTRVGADTVFASELPVLLAALPTQPGPDHLSMAHWLASSPPPPGSSLFAGVRRLEAGHLLELGSDRPDPRRYWSLRYEAPLRGSSEEMVGRLRDALTRSVRRRVANVTNAAVLLSGGLDSSSVAALLASGRGDPPTFGTYSATFPNHPSVDESSLIDATTRRLGLSSTRILVRGGSALRGALDYLTTWRVPPTSPNLFFWTPLMERAAADGVQVMLDGEGGDELFGFSPYLLADRVRRGRLLSAVALTARFPGSSTPPASTRVWRLRRFGLKGAVPPVLHRAIQRTGGKQRYAPSWMLPATARDWLDSEDWVGWKSLPGPRWWAFLVDSVVRGIGPALVYEQSRRRASTAGLEARHPLVDVDVIELVLRLPPELAYDARFSRPLLRQTVAGVLPDEVRLRPAKSSFDALFHASLAGPDLPVVRRLLGAATPRVGAYVDVDAIRRELFEPGPPPPGRARMGWAIRVWRLAMAECWLASLEDKDFLGRFAEKEGLARPDYSIESDKY